MIDDQDHKKALDVMLEILNERRGLADDDHGDVLHHMIQDMKTENFLTDEFVVQLMFGLLFVSFDSLSTALTMAFKLLAENPLVFDELTVRTILFIYLYIYIWLTNFEYYI
jgi:cytochrome P450